MTAHYSPLTPVERLLDGIDRVVKALLSVCAFSIFLVVLAQVLMRYVFSAPLYWAEELAKYLMIYATCIGAASAYRFYGHPRLMIVTSIFKGPGRVWYDLLTRVPVVIFFAYLLPVSWKYAQANEWMSTPGMQVSFFWPFAAIPIGAALVLLYLALDTLNILIWRRSWLLGLETLSAEEELVTP